MKPRQGSQRIVVIGAGVAGLAAARELRSRGHTVTVLEARDRIGGRILTRRNGAVASPIELGAEFIHGAAPSTMRLVRAAGLAVARTGGAMRTAQAGRLRTDDAMAAIERVLGRIDPAAPDEPLARFLARRPGGAALAKARAAAAVFVRGFHAADLDRIGAHSLAPGAGETPGGAAGGGARLVDEQAAIPRWLARGLGRVLRLRAVVTEVAWQRHRVVLEVLSGATGTRRRLRARAVVVTVPIGVLQAPAGSRGGIAFRPDPPRARDAVSRLAMGSVVKLEVAFDELPWARRAGAELGFLRTPGSAFQAWWARTPPRTPQRAPRPRALATAWCGGPAAAALARLPKAEIVALAVRDLARGLGVPRHQVAATVGGAWMHDWEHDPFARGAYSYPGVGGANARRVLARPVEDTLFFAGEATAEPWGTVESALASGLRAARQVDAALRRTQAPRSSTVIGRNANSS